MKRISLSIVSILMMNQPALAESSLSLEGFLGMVREQSLGIKLEAAKSRAANAKAVGINLPPPMVSVIQMDMQGGDSASGFEVSQDIPFPTKLSGDHSARQLEAQAQGEAAKAVNSETMARARLLYFSLWAAQEKVGLLKEKRAAIEQHIKLSRAGSRSDSFSQIHILKAESDVDALENEILMADQAIKNRQIEAAEFVNADPSHFKPVAEEPPMASIPQNGTLSAPHQLESARLTLESFRSRQGEAKSSWFPDFNLRYKQMGATAMYPRYNEVMVGVSLPFLYFWEPHAASSTASAQTLQAEIEYSRERRKTETEKASLLLKAESLRKQLDTLNNKLLPRAEKRMRLVHTLAPRDMETLQDHRETMEAFPDLKLKALEYREQYEEAISELQKYARQKDSNE